MYMHVKTILRTITSEHPTPLVQDGSGGTEGVCSPAVALSPGDQQRSDSQQDCPENMCTVDS